MIEILNRTMQIPPEEKFIGFTGDNKVESRAFEITDRALFDFDFKLDIKNASGSVGIIDLLKTVGIDRIILTWEVLQEHIANDGVLYAQLRAFSGNNEIWHSEVGCFNVGNSINATEYFPSPLPSEFEQMEERATTARNEAVEAKDIVVGKADEVAVNTQIVTDNTAVVVQKAAEVEDDAVEVAENTEITALNAQQATQALADLLAMLGKDIATLVNGKLNPLQIPALSINDVFEVSSADNMTSLNAQRGDVALIVADNVVTDSYILATDDPTQLVNWKKLGVSYVANAGHSVTADEAVNATMINNHRLVYMTQAQYDAAVKDPDTVYMVGVE